MKLDTLKSICELLSCGFLTINSDGIVRECNRKGSKLLGISEQKIIGSKVPYSYWEIYNEFEKKLSIQEFPTFEAFQTGNNINNRVLGIKFQKTDFIKWIEISIIFLKGNVSKNSGEAIVIFKDFSKIVEIHKALTDERILLKTVINNLPDAIFAKDKDLKKILTNKADLNNIGLPEEEVIGKTDNEYFPEEYAKSFTLDDLEVLLKSKNIINREEKITDTSGNIKWLSTSKVPLKNAKGDIIGLIGIARDITEKKKIERQLAFNQYGIDNINISIFMFQDDGSITYVNKYACNMLGYTKEELLKMTVIDIGSDISPKSWKKHRAKVKEKLADTIYSTIKRKDNTLFPAEITITYFKYENKFYSYLFVSDITEREKARKELEDKNKVFKAMNIEYIRKNEQLSESLEYITMMNRELEHAVRRAEESDKLKSAFLANLSHEIRTPMNGILGFTQLLKQQILTDKPNLNYIDMIQTNGTRLINLINDIVDISHIQSNQIKTNPTEIDIVQLLQSVIDSQFNLANNSNIDLIFSPTNAKKILIETDGSKLETALSKIINNALKYTEEGYIEISFKKNKNKIAIIIKDTGIGIDPEMGDKIFKIFMQGDNELTRRYEGLGIGLSIAKEYIQTLGGTLWYDSEPNKGTTFKINLPLKLNLPEPVLKKKTINPDSLKVLKGKKILILDSERSSELIYYLQMTFKTNYAKFFLANNILEAFDIIEKEEGMDLIILNLNFVGMELLEAIKGIKSNFKHTRIIALTSVHSVIKRNIAQNAGCDIVVKQNIKRTTLLEKIIESL